MSYRLGRSLKRVALRVSKEFKWMEHLAAAGAAVEEYATLRQREIDEEGKRMIWIKKEEEKQKRQKELRRGKEVFKKKKGKKQQKDDFILLFLLVY